MLRQGIKIGLFVLIAVFFAPGIPPHYDFVHFSLPPPLALEGKLAPNNILDKATPLVLDKPIGGPESIAQRGDELFTGLKDGTIVKIKNGKVTKLASIGGECVHDWDIMSCGRVAGVRLDSKGKLVVADAVNGIYRVDPDTGSTEKLVGVNTPIDGLVPKFPDDVDIDNDGNIYWSDASTIGDINQIVLEALAGPSARLVKYDPKTKTNTVLMSNLHFSNGVQLSSDQTFVLVSETMRARVWRYYIKGKNQGQKDIFVDNLPGLPDNVRPNGRGGFYITLASPRFPTETSLLEVIGDWPLVRRFVVRIYHFFTKALDELHNFFPNEILQEWVVWAKQFGPLGDLKTVPFKTIIVETDQTGKIIGSLQNEKGPITALSEISVGKEWAYFGSPTLDKLYRLKVSELYK